MFLQLEGKNTGIILPDADVDLAVEQIVTGSVVVVVIVIIINILANC